MYVPVIINGDDIQLIASEFFAGNTYYTVSGINFVYSLCFLQKWSILSYSVTFSCSRMASAIPVFSSEIVFSIDRMKP